MAFLHWLVHVTGSDYGLPYGHFSFYDLLSGSASDLGKLALFGALIAWYRRNECHVDACRRLGRHPVAGTPFVTCRKHHPHGAPSHQDVIAAHRAAQEAS